MRFVRYGAVGAEKPGVLDAEGGLRDLSEEIDDLSGAVLADLPRIDPERLPCVAGNPRLGVPVGRIGKIICIGLNYSDHAAEAGMEEPEEPIVFMKATSALNGPNDPVLLPRGSQKSDWEVELGVVIGQEAKYLNEDNALDCVAGYTIVNDLSERAFQTERGGQWTKGKSCDTFGPVGPWLVTPDEAGDPQNLAMELDLNGAAAQRGNSSAMIFTVTQILVHLSEMMRLEPGDVIATGTPPGVGMGMKPPRFLQEGDEMALRIAGLGEQRQKVMRDA
ncbi:2-hydroxyhepta-2,4-diene-1,7-dioate isomerase [Litorivita pollutaquae]|uniref:2-hydroxyhepta-2,4-diene-1,7-dioate isomerase n=1 Tax=Litorivita pollutaquae TaxID=2200892 RepID=A0A2V4MYM9_9RHOB|nr:fumarylacetoacetate hydrolase family protein [Litorivita pollutaquae]PYC46772.1 2-hydroxyhepta-2,4-diene-1,7-dioate isomerase [Litorivita pollutaquae]